MDDDADPFGGLGLLGRDEGLPLTCGQCGWQRSGGFGVAGGLLGDPSMAECPKCHAPVTGEMPSASEIAAARRAPRA